jgi:hypothetical protein
MIALTLLVGRLGRPACELRRMDDSWSVIAKRGERTWTISEGEVLTPADRLAFRCVLDEELYFLLLGVDGAGSIALQAPKGMSALRLAHGSNDIPFAIELDDKRGEERLFALFSRAPLDGEAAKQALATAVARARAQNRSVAAADVNISADVMTIGFKTQ